MRIALHSESLKAQWRKQIMSRRGRHWIEARRGLVALAFIDRSRAQSGFPEIESVQTFVLYEDEVDAPAEQTSQRASLRFASYRATRIPHGVRWGGAENSSIFKDLTVAPQPKARGQRIDINKPDLLRLALDLDSWLSLASRHPGLRRRGLRLPRLWAGFRSRDAIGLEGYGPEFDIACASSRLAAKALFEKSRRGLDGLTLHPLAWVSERADDAVAVFAQLNSVPKRQVASVARLPDDVKGYSEATEYDLFNSRFRKPPLRRETASVGSNALARRRPRRRWMD